MSFDQQGLVETRLFTQEQPTRQADIWSLEGLRDWLRTQPAQIEYDFTEADTCPLTRYFAAFGLKKNGAFTYGGRELHTPGAKTRPPLIQVVGTFPYTYGAALTRCEAELAKRT